MAQIQIDLVQNFVDLITRFSMVATTDPISGVLLTVGALLTGVSVVVFGVLAVGGVLTYLGRLLE